MYKSDEIDLFPKEIEKIYSCLENDIMKDIIRRIAETGEITRTADWQLSRLYNAGADKTEIKKHIQKALELSNTEINMLYSDTLKEGYLRDETLYKAVGQEFIPFEENVALQQLIEAVREQTSKQLRNITQTMGFSVKQPNGRKIFKTVDSYFKDTMDNAVMHLLNGTFDYNSIIKKVTDEMTKSGVRSINYASGISTRIDVAARRAILTGANQVTGKISSDNMQKLNTEFVETSWHSTARPTHQVWQGRVFYWDRANPNAEKKEKGVLYKSFINETGYGEVDGLCGANCRHTFYPFIPGISVRTYTDEQLEELNRQENEKKKYNGKEYNKYEATQYQRRLETLMRKHRQDINLLKKSGLEDDSDEVIAARCRYQEISRRYSDFSEKMGLREHRDRVNVDGLKDIGNGTKKFDSEWEKNNVDLKNDSEYQNAKAKAGVKNIFESGNINSKRVGNNNVDLNKMAEEFGKKFNQLTNDLATNNSLRKYAKAMLTHRNGTDGEDLYIISKEAGKKLFSKTNSKNILGVELNKEEIEMIRQMPSKIGIHNHPTNVLPTGSDFVVAGYRKYDFGLVVTHDLRVFQYKVGNRPFPATYLDNKVDKYMGKNYNLPILEAQEKALEELSKEGLIEWREIVM